MSEVEESTVVISAVETNNGVMFMVHLNAEVMWGKQVRFTHDPKEDRRMIKHARIEQEMYAKDLVRRISG